MMEGFKILHANSCLRADMVYCKSATLDAVRIMSSM
jgi:hypothetical protein